MRAHRRAGGVQPQITIDDGADLLSVLHAGGAPTA